MPVKSGDASPHSISLAGPSVVVLNPRPEVRDVSLEPMADVDVQMALVGHAVSAFVDRAEADVFEQLAQGRLVVSDDDHAAAVGVAGSPEVVVVVAGDRIGQTVAVTEDFDRSRLAV